ncbi:electron transfer flavoprotein subunit alpha/FixB family protein [bacterium]|nr:electron transfer flavoprotein subunit alpha/FixB family protein [bacterium]
MNVLVYIEVRDGEVKKASLESLSEGHRIASASGGAVCAVIPGANLDAAVAAAKGHGAAKVFTNDSADLANYVPEGYLASVVEAASQCNAEVVLLGATSQGRDLAPRVAAKMGVMFLPDVTKISTDDGLVATRPVYAGKVNISLKAKELPVVISTRPNTFDLAANEGAGELVAISPEFNAKAKVVEVVASGGEKLDVAEADRIVAGGRGLKEPENFKVLEDLADSLGAAVGASRAVVDAGWRPHSEQVGQTGKTVGPTLYFAVGISGAVQHVAGMRTSKVIVAINKDADAPIFKLADYGIVGDAMEVVPALTAALK